MSCQNSRVHAGFSRHFKEFHWIKRQKKNVTTTSLLKFMFNLAQKQHGFHFLVFHLNWIPVSHATTTTIHVCFLCAFVTLYIYILFKLTFVASIENHLQNFPSQCRRLPVYFRHPICNSFIHIIHVVFFFVVSNISTFSMSYYLL